MRCGMGKYVLVQENVPQNGINRIYQDAETGVMIIDAIRGFCWEREQMEVLLHTFEKKILLIVSRLTDCVHVWHEPGGTDQSAGISGCFVCGLRNAARRCSICRGGNVAGYSGCEHDRAGNDRSFVLFHGTDRRIFF